MKDLKKPKKPLKLNIGCGSNKIEGYINIDGEKSCHPDLVLDIAEERLPYKAQSVSEIVMFHCIEHIQKAQHRHILLEFGRVLEPEGILYLSYPNFWECAQRWHDNRGGQKRFWEATLYGRQLYPGDYHVCAMDPDELTALLYECGFKDVVSQPEMSEEFNTITAAYRDSKGPIPSYETIIAGDMQNMTVRDLAKGKKECH